jgi:hypothetical protein
LLWILVALIGVAVASTTTASASTFVYDGQSNAHVENRDCAAVDSGPAQLSGSREGFASAPLEARRTSTTSTHSFIATEAVDDVAAAVSRPAGVGDDFVSQVANNGKGTVWRPPGTTGNAGTVRIMEPTAQYPNGYVRFYNDGGQPIGLNGNPGPNSMTHIPLNPDGTYPIPKGWGAG